MRTLIERFFCLVGGISALGLGYEVYAKGGWWSAKSQMFVNYEGIRGPIASLFVIMGTMALYLAFKKNKICDYICIECQHVEENLIGANVKCSKCGSDMEELDGFYSRHPDKK